MNQEHKPVMLSGTMLTVMILVNAILLSQGLIHGESWYKGMIISVPLLLVTLIDVYKERTADHSSKN